MKMTSGACRIALRSAACSVRASEPISRWLMIDFLLRNRNSIGSSNVSTWPVTSSLRWSSIEAIVVDLPEPAAPTTRISPRRSMIRSFRTSGSCSASSLGMSCGMKRITAEIEPRCRNALRRKLPTPWTGIPMFSSRESSSSRKCASVRRSASSETMAWGASRSWLIGTQTPLILIVIGEPTDRNRSEACFSDIRLNIRSSDMGVSGVAAGAGVRLGDQAYDPGQGIANTAERMKRQVYRPERVRSRASSAKQIVDAGLGAGLGVDPLDDDCAVEAVLAVSGGQVARNDDGTGGHTAVSDLPGRTVVDL